MHRLLLQVKSVSSHFVNLLKKKKFWLSLLFAVFITGIFLLDASHESYPDEFDNISGGWLILHGTLIYKGFFTHHGPFPYFLSAFLEIFSGQSFVKFRIVYALLLVLVNLLFFAFLRFKFKEKIVDYYPFFILFLGVESTYYWSQMLLADNVSAYLFLSIYILLTFKVFYKKLLTLWDLAFVSIAGALGLYSSLTFTYMYIIFIFAAFALYVGQLPHLISRKSLIQVIKAITIFALPHFVYLIYLLVTQSLHDYLFQNVVFNTKYYIYNYPRKPGATSFNPIRYAVFIINSYYNNIYTLFLQIKDFNLYNPFNATMVVGNTAIFIYYILKKHYKLALLMASALTFSAVRSNLLYSSEKDYQAAVYIFISFFNVFFLIPNLYEDIGSTKDAAKRVIFSGLFILVLIYSFASAFSFLVMAGNKFYAKYMGNAPLIYDRPKVAPIMNTILSKNDYTLIDPFNFEDDFYLNAKLASKYHILIPGFGKSPDIQKELLADLDKTNPKAIWYNKNFFILGNSVAQYGQFLTNYLNKNYVEVINYKKGKTRYTSVIPANVELDIETSLYLRKDYVQEAINKLVNAGYLKIKQ